MINDDEEGRPMMEEMSEGDVMILEKWKEGRRKTGGWVRFGELI